MYKIDKNIPLPEKESNYNKSNDKYPWKMMGVGDSVKINIGTLDDGSKEDVIKFRSRLTSSYRRFGNNKVPIRRFTYRYLKSPTGEIDGLRVWRKADFDPHS